MAYPSEVSGDLERCCVDFLPLTVDGELIGTRYVVFDVREVRGQRVEAMSLETRLETHGAAARCPVGRRV
ncbi:hypothetical protein [Pseudomonas saponiphila]|uniref:hypothetical protein n=1 Tax=Pseudomonas saponiphila TaxID=556534 RepID=UPI001428D156|nr:hypothetical protein [Pseudomonas saponiphila]